MDIIHIFSSLCVMFGIYEFSRAASRRACTRAGDLAVAHEMLETHYYSLERLEEEPATSEAMLSLALYISEAISNRGLAEEICRALVSGDDEIAPKSASLIGELDALRRSRPDVTETFERAIMAGVMALIYRWPETACKAETILNALVTQKKNEVMTVVRFAQSRVSGRFVPAGY